MKSLMRIEIRNPVRRLTGNSYNTTTISGSQPWMSPEQIQGKDLTLKADVFSYGIILWEIATGEWTCFFTLTASLGVAADGCMSLLPRPMMKKKWRHEVGGQ